MGYDKPDVRSDSDKLVRDYLAKWVNQLRRRIEEVKIKFTDAGKLLYLDDLERINQPLETLMGRLQCVDYNDGQFFDVAFGENEVLVTILAIDGQMVFAMVGAENKIEQLFESTTPVEGFDEVEAQISQMSELFDERVKIIRNCQ